ncbi:hypothetical protein GQ600_6739 [Phytophthora cactorum]|nr:hypothetical protein GQ600_6739 [Phytophthora cactorum]
MESLVVHLQRIKDRMRDPFDAPMPDVECCSTSRVRQVAPNDCQIFCKASTKLNRSCRERRTKDRQYYLCM